MNPPPCEHDISKLQFFEFLNKKFKEKNSFFEVLKFVKKIASELNSQQIGFNPYEILRIP